MAKKKTIAVNHWKTLHNQLNAEKQVEARTKCLAAMQISYDTFYRKMRNPQKLKFYEKQIVANCYGVQVEVFFPDTEMPVIKLTA